MLTKQILLRLYKRLRIGISSNKKGKKYFFIPYFTVKLIQSASQKEKGSDEITVPMYKNTCNDHARLDVN